MTDTKIRLLLVDDQMIIRQGLRSLLEAKPDLEVVGEAENGQQAVAQVETLQPDVVLMDVRMPVMDGVAATRLICQQFSATKVLVLTTFDDDDYVSQAMRLGALRLSAKGHPFRRPPQRQFEPFIKTIPRWVQDCWNSRSLTPPRFPPSPPAFHRS